VDATERFVDGAAMGHNRQSRIDLGFADEVAGIPRGDRLRECIQCGNLSVAPSAP